MHPPLGGHGSPSRDQGLTRHLPAEHPHRGLWRAHPAEDVLLDPLEVEERDQPIDDRLPARHAVGRERHAARGLEDPRVLTGPPILEGSSAGRLGHGVLTQSFSRMIVFTQPVHPDEVGGAHGGRGRSGDDHHHVAW